MVKKYLELRVFLFLGVYDCHIFLAQAFQHLIPRTSGRCTPSRKTPPVTMCPRFPGISYLLRAGCRCPVPGTPEGTWRLGSVETSPSKGHCRKDSGTHRVFSETAFPFELPNFLLSFQCVNVGTWSFSKLLLWEVHLLKYWMKIMYFMQLEW